MIINFIKPPNFLVTKKRKVHSERSEESSLESSSALPWHQAVYSFE